jgi:chemotaxis protein methyltransferase CheR
MFTSPHVDYTYLRQVVFRFSKNVLDPSCDRLFDARLARFLHNQGMSHLQELVDYLRTHRDTCLERAIAEAMTINETSFFRDARPFELLRTTILPGLIKERRNRRSLRLWSAACSTGQEALSLAMLIREHFPALAGWDVRIEATDISAEIVERARAGRYHRIEMNRGLPARLVRYFDRAGEDWVAKPEIRSLCSFQKVNLCSGTLPFLQPFDVIFLRNVMLYFTHEVRTTLLQSIHALTATDGALFLGSSEQPSDPSLWTPVLASGTVCYKPRSCA